MNRQRVLTVLPSVMGGGAERQMLLMLQNLSPEEFDPVLCVFEDSGELRDEVPRHVPVVSLHKHSPRDLPRLIFRMRSVIERVRPDVVLSKVDYANVIVSLALSLISRRVPTILGEESVASSAASHMSARRARLALLRWSYERASSVTVPSPGVARDLRESIGVRARDVRVVPNMIDLAKVVQQARTEVEVLVRDGEALIVAAGRMQPPKGHADLLEALAILQGRRRCRLLVLGDGADRARLEGIAARLQLGESVGFLGFVANPFAYMARSDVFVSPSHFESFGNVLIEAMAVGVPVVSTRVPAGPEWLIDDGKNGVFANPRDPRDLANKIEWVLDHPDRAARMAAEAREFASRFDVANIMSHYVELLQPRAPG